jgi:glycosyltransferase involved in cell wall biosynthesis
MEISVIITAYNKGPYIKDCLLGVLNQDFKGEFEIIVADDCSTDNTNEIIQSLNTHYNFNKVKYTRHDVNKGLMGNFIWSINQAQGKYIALCDGDDYWSRQDKIKLQFKVLEEHNNFIGVGTREIIIDTRNIGAAVNYTNMYFDYSESCIIKKEDFFSTQQLPFHTSTLMFRNSEDVGMKLVRFVYVKISNDIVLYHILNSQGNLYFLNEVTVNRFHNLGGITSDSEKRKVEIGLNFYFLYKQCANLYNKQDLRMKLIDISTHYKNITLKRYINRSMSIFLGEVMFYLKKGNYSILHFAFDVVKGKLKSRFFG